MTQLLYFSDSDYKEFILIFFFKQKTAYEMLPDWSSDVCSSDLLRPDREPGLHARTHGNHRWRGHRLRVRVHRSEERRVGKECRSRWSRYHSKKKAADGQASDWYCGGFCRARESVCGRASR